MHLEAQGVLDETASSRKFSVTCFKLRMNSNFYVFGAINDNGSDSKVAQSTWEPGASSQRHHLQEFHQQTFPGHEKIHTMGFLRSPITNMKTVRFTGYLVNQSVHRKKNIISSNFFNTIFQISGKVILISFWVR